MAYGSDWFLISDHIWNRLYWHNIILIEIWTLEINVNFLFVISGRKLPKKQQHELIDSECRWRSSVWRGVAVAPPRPTWALQWGHPLRSSLLPHLSLQPHSHLPVSRCIPDRVNFLLISSFCFRMRWDCASQSSCLRNISVKSWSV